MKTKISEFLIHDWLLYVSFVWTQCLSTTFNHKWFLRMKKPFRECISINRVIDCFFISDVIRIVWTQFSYNLFRCNKFHNNIIRSYSFNQSKIAIRLLSDGVLYRIFLDFWSFHIFYLLQSCYKISFDKLLH